MESSSMGIKNYGIANAKNTDAINTAAVANIVEMVFCVLKEVGGNEVSSSINGSELSREVIAGIVLTKLRSKVEQKGVSC